MYPYWLKLEKIRQILVTVKIAGQKWKIYCIISIKSNKLPNCWPIIRINNNSLFFPNEPTKHSSGTSNEQIDYDYIDFKYLEANSLNINFRRDKEWKSSPCLDEIISLEEQLFHDTELTFAEKSVIYK